MASATPALNLPLDKVAFIILKAREYDVKEGDSDPDEGSNPTDDGNADVLEDQACWKTRRTIRCAKSWSAPFAT